MPCTLVVIMNACHGGLPVCHLDDAAGVVEGCSEQPANHCLVLLRAGSMVIICMCAQTLNQ
jgi:hypothetical protein